MSFEHPENTELIDVTFSHVKVAGKTSVSKLEQFENIDPTDVTFAGVKLFGRVQLTSDVHPENI